MLRGEFRFQNGLVVPNNITTYGCESILKAFLRADPFAFYIGLCDAVPDPNLKIQDVTEPTLATNGYARLAVARDSIGWPGDGLVNGEAYVESLPLVWAAAGGNFDQPITRMFLTPEESALVGEVFCLSGPLPEGFTIEPTTPEPDRTFKYRLYLR
jgi:hypothetical protein